ncbi:MAG: hypothetical protein QF464_24400, partial [Myxococcota bacterium]|nr:hypothetical protein [Myxococcota bacterium]
AFPLLATACDGDDEDLCDGGLWVCDGQVAICDDDNATIVELCNGEDDDCDGALDEGFVTLGEACDGDDEDDCESGTWVCTEDGADVMCDDDEEAWAELCNEEDDDCDGETDEPFVLKGAACDGDDADLCVTGVWICAADGAGLTCTDDAATSEEACNDLDDDCDNAVDEDFADKHTPCDGEDDDQCANGAWLCGPAGLVCIGDGPSLPDVCNGVDDDCDGVTDPGCCDTEGQACCEGDTCNAPLSCSGGVCV